MTFSFPHLQASITKLQILTLAAKLVVLCPAREVQLLAQYALNLARYDADWDVRDRGRFLNGLLRGVRQHTENGGPGASHSIDDDEEEDVGGVILRREQIKLVLLGDRTLAKTAAVAGAAHLASAVPRCRTDGPLFYLQGTVMATYYRLAHSPAGADAGCKGVSRCHVGLMTQLTQLCVIRRFVHALVFPDDWYFGTLTLFTSQEESQPTPPPAMQWNPSFQATPRISSPALATSRASASPGGTSPGPGSTPSHTLAKGKFKDLDAFLDESTEEEESDDDDDGDENHPVHAA
jgi:AP-3 complex subunit beta